MLSYFKNLKKIHSGIFDIALQILDIGIEDE